MITLIVVLLILAAYLVTGWQIAIWSLPGIWAAARQQRWHAELYARGRVKLEMARVTLFWPICLARRAINHQLNLVIDRYDPERPARLIKARDQTDLRQAEMSDPPGRMGS